MWLEVGPGHTLTHLVRGRCGEPTIASLAEADAEAAMARALGALWAAGCAPDWPSYHRGARRQRVALPTYPFQRQRYWLEAGPRAAPAVDGWTKRADVATWCYRPLWKQAAPLTVGGMAPFEPGRWLLLADDAGLADELHRRFHEAGHDVVVAAVGERLSLEGHIYHVRPHEPGDLRTLVDALAAADRWPTHVVHLWGIDTAAGWPRPPADVEDRCFYSLVALAQALARARGDVPHHDRRGHQ